MRLFKFVIIYLLIIFHVYCFASDAITLGVTKKQANTMFNRLEMKDLAVYPSINDFVPYDIDDINWNISATPSPNTYSLFLQSLTPAYFYTSAYNETGNSEYLYKAIKILDSWIAYESSATKLNRYTWYDHSVAMRTDIIIYMLKAMEQKDIDTLKYIELAHIHAKWLMDNKNYYYNHNHGIYQDIALIYAGYYLNEQNYIEHGTNRLNKQLIYAFPNKYVHVENSVAYHTGVMGFLKIAANALSEYDAEASNVLLEYTKNAEEFLAYSLMPNLSNQPTGDTIGALLPPRATLSKYSSSLFEYIKSHGKSGLKPKLFKIYKEDGYAFFREDFGSDNSTESTWLMFKSGYASITHKHKDDMSVNFYSKGHEIFIDPGMYNYMAGNIYHGYLNSVLSHNTLFVDDKNYLIGTNATKRAGISSFTENKDYVSVEGYNNHYPNVELQRKIIYFGESDFIIVDDAEDTNNHKYTQNFHLADDVEILETTPEHTTLKLKGSTYKVLIKQLNDSDDVSIIKNKDNNINNISVRSIGLSQVKETKSLRFSKYSKNARFVTYIKVYSDADELNDNVSYKDDLLKIKDIAIKLEPITSIYDKTKVAIDNNEHKIILNNLQGDDIEYCYYLVQSDNKKILRSSFKQNPFEFDLEPKVEYAVVGYIRNKSTMKTRIGVIGFVRYINKKHMYIPKDRLEQVPYIVKKNIVATKKKNNYEFSLIHTGFNDLSVKWFVYKNGASYNYFGGSDKFIYTFDEPGVYTIFYRASDRYLGEIAYGYSSEIVID